MPTETLVEHEGQVAETSAPPVPMARAGELGPAISVSGLVKRFGSTSALDGLDLTVRSADVHGFDPTKKIRAYSGTATSRCRRNEVER